jgi:hypothetical protein
MHYHRKDQGGTRLKMKSASSSYPDLIVEECPVGCNNCKEVYVNQQLGHRIVCLCHKCGHRQIFLEKSKTSADSFGDLRAIEPAASDEASARDVNTYTTK